VTSHNLDDLREHGHGYIVGRNRRRSGEVFDYTRARPGRGSNVPPPCRRYRARGRCVTDHGLANEQKTGPFLESEVGEALSEPWSSRKSPPQWLCHQCRRSASAFVRLSALRPRRNRRKNRQISRRRRPT
jgi:hypothetical protein